jgi:hypothetical protein
MSGSKVDAGSWEGWSPLTEVPFVRAVEPSIAIDTFLYYVFQRVCRFPWSCKSVRCKIGEKAENGGVRDGASTHFPNNKYLE